MAVLAAKLMTMSVQMMLPGLEAQWTFLDTIHLKQFIEHNAENAMHTIKCNIMLRIKSMEYNIFNTVHWIQSIDTLN